MENIDYAGELPSVRDLSMFVVGRDEHGEVPRGAQTAYIYLIHVKMGNQSYSTICALTHYRFFSQEEREAMITQALEDTHQRVKGRRSQRLPPNMTREHLLEQNEPLFATDAEFFTTVMCDRFGFKKVLYEHAEATIEQSYK